MKLDIFSLPPAQKPMTFRQLEDTINKWTGELEEQEKYFLEQATQVNAWDRVVMENGEKVSSEMLSLLSHL